MVGTSGGEGRRGGNGGKYDGIGRGGDVQEEEEEIENRERDLKGYGAC